MAGTFSWFAFTEALCDMLQCLNVSEFVLWINEWTM